MYTGNLIDDLIAAVERAETSIRVEPEQGSNLNPWFAVMPGDVMTFDAGHQFAGVA
jgi:hypothetical protein